MLAAETIGLGLYTPVSCTPPDGGIELLKLFLNDLNQCVSGVH